VDAEHEEYQKWLENHRQHPRVKGTAKRKTKTKKK
jgi:hypothetical protein